MFQKIVFIVFLIFLSFSFSQNKRDLAIQDSLSFFHMYNPEKYDETKSALLNLEKEYGYEPELKYSLLPAMYTNKDLDFFKQELSVLVRDYGFNYTYVKKSASYYVAISEGELKDWFKEMYLKNHVIWLDNNFDKQQDLYVINQTGNKNIMIDSFGETVKEKLELSKDQEKKLDGLIDEMCFANITDLYQITRKNNNYPTAKSFALIQNGVSYTIQTSLFRKGNLEKFWILFYPYFKTAYLNNEMDYNLFKIYDYQNYKFFGYQHFGLLHPDQFTDEDGQEIPVKDIFFYSAIKKEFGWE